MAESERQLFMWLWNTAAVFLSLLYFGGGLFRIIIITAVIAISTALGYGKRWLYRAGFVLMLAGIVDCSGFLPPIQQWPNLMRDAVSSMAMHEHEQSIEKPAIASRGRTG
jgi:hypothetical protein